jgi:type II secretory pathway component PulF
VTVLALSTNETLWWITLAVGLVVAIVVWILLERLRRAVDRVDAGVDAVWTMGKRVAQNTSTSHLLQGTKEQGVGLLEELQHHRAPAGGGQG